MVGELTRRPEIGLLSTMVARYEMNARPDTPPPGHSSKTLAIIGGGPSCVMVLAHLVRQELRNQLTIKIFEPRPEIGRGMAYQDDHRVFFLNTPPEGMGVHSDDPEEFFRHLTGRELQTRAISRSTYGHYLELKARSIIAELKLLGINVEHVRGKVGRLDIGSVHTIHVGKSLYFANICVIATGATYRQPAEHLHNDRRYIFSALDVARIRSIPNGSKIGVVGTGQSAIDVSVLRGQQCENDHVSLFSRSGVLPRVRNINARRKAPPLLQDCRTLESVLSKLAAEIKWPSGRLLVGDMVGSIRSFAIDAKRAVNHRPSWQTTMDHITPEINEVWARLDDHQRHRFLAESFPLMYYLRSAVPVGTAEKVIALHRSRRLEVLGGNYRLSTASTHIAYKSRAIERDFDFVVNAAGLTPDGTLEYVAIGEHRARPGWTSDGGLKVNLSNMKVSCAHPEHLSATFALGYPTKGATLIVNSIELVRPHARVIAEGVAQLALKKENLRCA